MSSQGGSRRTFLRRLGVLGAAGVPLIGDAGATLTGDPGATLTDDGPALAASTGDCTPGHADGDPPCQQVDADAEVLTRFDSTSAGLPVFFSYPCGWTTDAAATDGGRQVTVRRDDLGGHGETVAVRVTVDDDTVGGDFIQQTKAEGHYDEVQYSFGGPTRTGLVSTPATAAHGTIAHAAVPVDGDLRHVEFSSTMSGFHCDADVRPDYWVVREMLLSLAPAPGAASASIDSPVRDGDVVLRAAPGQEIVGSTTLPDCIGVTMTLRSDGSNVGGATPYLRTAGAEDQSSLVVDDGTFSAGFDASDLVDGQRVSITVLVGDETLLQREATAVWPPSVTMDNQESDGGQVLLVDSATLPRGGFVTIHDLATLQGGDPTGSVLGTSKYLGDGEHQHVEATLHSPLTGGPTRSTITSPTAAGRIPRTRSMANRSPPPRL